MQMLPQGMGVEPRVQLGRRGRDPSPLGGRTAAKQRRTEGGFSALSSVHTPPPPGASGVGRGGGGDLRVQVTPSSAEVFSNDEAASLLLALSPRSSSPFPQSPHQRIPGLTLSRGPSGSLDERLPPPLPMSRCPSLVSETTAPVQRPEGGSSLGGSSLATIESLPLSRNDTGIPLSRCLSLLNDDEPAAAPANLGQSDLGNIGSSGGSGGKLKGVAFERDTSGLSMSALLKDDEPSTPGQSFTLPTLSPDGKVLKGLPLTRQATSGLSVSGCLSLLD